MPRVREEVVERKDRGLTNPRALDTERYTVDADVLEPVPGEAVTQRGKRLEATGQDVVAQAPGVLVHAELAPNDASAALPWDLHVETEVAVRMTKRVFRREVPAHEKSDVEQERGRIGRRRREDRDRIQIVAAHSK